MTMTMQQLTLFASEGYEGGRRAIGAIGEQIAARLLEAHGYDIVFNQIGSRDADLKAIDVLTGEIKRIEVKTARRSCDGKWRFTLYKAGSTDYHDADYVILIPLLKTGLSVPYVIPVEQINQHAIVLSSHPETYAGRWSEYRQKSHELRLP